ncbi:MAG: hypothetical protein KC731_31120 [Myxococcales bacterium]|nr:hypothetical protein [Myxococcales bacterium]
MALTLEVLSLVSLIAGVVACGSEVTTGTGGGGAGGSAEGGGGMSAGGQGQGAADPDLACIQLCPHPGYGCEGVDTEIGSGQTSEVTPTGCTFTATLPASGTVEMTIDCLSVRACITASEGGCVGEVGACYPLTTDGMSFSYTIPDCVQGSLSCEQLSP